MNLEINQVDQTLLMTPPKIREFCNGCDRLHRRCDLNDPSVQKYYFQERGFCFDAAIDGAIGTMSEEGFKPDQLLEFKK